ncbi:hypothetical protein PGB90_000638 [Kerria lacca]
MDSPQIRSLHCSISSVVFSAIFVGGAKFLVSGGLATALLALSLRFSKCF